MGCSHQLGIIDKNIESLSETAYFLNGILNNIQKKHNYNFYDLGLLFSSRGSFPFLKALDYISEDLNKNFKLKLIPHIFSLENLLEIVSDYDEYQYPVYQPVISTIYNDIAEKMSDRITTVANMGSEKFFLSDWDEVCSGNNITERIKIYNRLKIGEIPFDIISFISNDGKDLRSANIKSFKRNFKKSPENYSTFDVLMKNKITWSDDEDFYDELGLKYPGIAAPSFSYLSNFIPKKNMGEFYKSFFSNYSKNISGNGKSLEYELYTSLINSDINQLISEENVMKSSYEAFIKSLKSLDEVGGLMNSQLLKYKYDIDIDKGNVYCRDNNRVILTRHIPEKRGKIAKIKTYRTPFTLVYDCNNSDSNFIMKLMMMYSRQINNAFKIKDLTHMNSANLFSARLRKKN